MITRFSWLAGEKKGSALIAFCASLLALMEMLSSIEKELERRFCSVPP
jgi:hypothetical protein